MLIHAASGGVGLAAIQMAQQHGAIVFATASTYKRATLRKLGVEYVYDSRSTDFADQILADTDGAGVDVVLNSLTNEGFVEATVRATAQNGRFAEIAKRDIWTPEQMAAARPDIAYEIVALDGTIMQDPERIKRLLTEVSDGLASGEWTPLPVEIYPLTEAKTAFRRMQQARHIGKIVLQMPNPLQPQDDRSYLITGGLGAIGLHTAAYLAQLGAGDIVLTSRRTPDADAQRTIANITERYRCRIHTFAADVGDESQVDELLGRIRAELPPLAGVAHLAGVLDDALLPQQSVERFRTTLAPKAFGAYHLDRLTKNDDLDFFIVYSSVSSVLGSPGQANYATANALLDGLVAERKAQGLPATGVNWGPWAQGRHGLFGGRARQSRCARPDSAGTHGRPQRARRGCRQRNWAGNRHQSQLAARREAAGRFSPTDSRPRVAECRRGDNRRQRVAPATARDTRGAARQFPDRIPAARSAAIPPARATARRNQPVPGPGYGFTDGGRTPQPVAQPVRWRVHDQRTAVFDYPTIGGLAEYLASQMPESDSESASESGTESGQAESVEAQEPSQSGEAESVAAPEPSSESVAASEPS